MADYVMKLLELEKRIINEFEVFKNYCRDTSEMDPKNLDTFLLLFKINYQIDQTREEIISNQGVNFNIFKENESQNNDLMVKSQILMTFNSLNELKEKIMYELNTFHNNDHGTDKTNLKNLDTILFEIIYQIDQMKNGILYGRNVEYFQEFKDVGIRKANALVRLQTLANSITCRIMNLDNNL